MTHHQIIMNVATDTALTVINGWYVLWFRYRNSRDATIRRLALRAKCKGTVGHDRILVAAQKRVERCQK